jgi:hypothetical protein
VVQKGTTDRHQRGHRATRVSGAAVTRPALLPYDDRAWPRRDDPNGRP